MTCCRNIFNLNINISSTLSVNSSICPIRIQTRKRNPSFSSSETQFRVFLSVSFHPTEVGVSGNRVVEPHKRRRLSPNVYSSELPLLPFDITQVLVPFERKTLHLYEARYIALLEESLYKKKKLFVHFVLDLVAVNDSSTEASFAARYGCLVIIENVERLDVGALVTIRGIGRVKIVEFIQADPYLKGVVVPIKDNAPDCESKVSTEIMKLKKALYRLNSLEIKLKAPGEAMLQTHILNSLSWAEKESFDDCDEAFVPSLAERVSFVALQPVSGSTQSELLKLQKEKLKAMDTEDTKQRLVDSLELVDKNISIAAAKLALQSLELQ